MNYTFDWSVIWDNIPVLLNGLARTILLSLLVIVLSMILAAPVAFARMSNILIVRWIAQIYIEVFRCTPLLVQLFWIYYALPTLTGITLPGYTSAAIALTANMTAFMAEAYRSGFQSVPKEQVEAGLMLRLTSFERMRHIIVPQALRQQLPVILSLNISLFKDTALVSTIAVPDLMFVANNIVAGSYRGLEVFTVAALMYFIIAFPVSLITSRIERNMLNQNEGIRPGPSLLARLMPGTRVKVGA
jgi:polar amino acid transport system permease protein